MKYFVCMFVALLSTSAAAAPAVSTATLKQNLTSVDYSSNGRQSGCGLRATAENKDNLSLNALITVFMKDTGATFGVVKVVARKLNMKNGVPVLKNGKVTYLNVGKLSSAWIKPDSLAQPKIYNRGSSHNDGYMETVDFASTVDLLVLMSQENFKVGLNLEPGTPDQVFTFDQWMDRREGNMFAACMANLSNVIEENKRKRSF